jgi:hypothetical protein
MALATYTDRLEQGNTVRKGLMSRVLAYVIEAKQSKAGEDNLVHLQALDDTTLANLGFNEAEIRNVRGNRLFV